MKKPCHIALLQPEIPHYRVEFFSSLRDNVDLLDVFVYNKSKRTEKHGYCLKTKDFKYIFNFVVNGILFYNPFVFLNEKYDVLVLMLHKGHFFTWLLLFTKFIHHKKIILWGHGISIKRYLSEEVKKNIFLKWMISFSDGVWLYTDKEVVYWKNVFPDKPIVSLNNTISGIDKIVDFIPSVSKSELKKKYGIKEEKIFLFCARFDSSNRRTDLLLDIINRLDNIKNGFVIIGNGDAKPDFSNYKNVYDMGRIYERAIKNELFSLSDIYFQPAWVGLSIVEAMGYGLPVFTFKRSEEVKQCVEYSYIKDGYNGLIFDSVDDFIVRGMNLSLEEVCKLGLNARTFVKRNLSMNNMVESALRIL